MKIKKLIALSIGSLFLLSSCKEKETEVFYGFVCSDNLFKFVEVTAIYNASNGDYFELPLSPEIMVVSSTTESSGTTDNGSTSTEKELLRWSNSTIYPDKVNATLEISFQKKGGVDYEAYKGEIIEITKYAYLSSNYTEKGLGNFTSNSTTDLGNLFDATDEFYGDALETYIDNLVAHPIIRP